MRWVAVGFAALVFAQTAAASAPVAVPAPASGNIRVEMVTVEAGATPKLTVANLSALGTGFHGAAVVAKSTKKAGLYFAFLVMFSTSTSTAGTVSLQIPNGTPVGKPMDDTKNCSVLHWVLHAEGVGGGGNPFEVVADALAYQPLRKGKSKPRTEVENDVSYQLKSAGCK